MFGKDLVVTSTLLATVPVEPAPGQLLTGPIRSDQLDAPFDIPPPGSCDERGLGEAIQGCHIRAARGLLDWSMHDLARSSGLSLSTIRRLENGASVPQTSRSHGVAVATLRRAGIGFAMVHRTVAICCL